MKIIKLKKTTSTEDYIRKHLKKYLSAREDIVVIADVQTKGRGTKGRSFSSQKGGLYMSVLHFHNGLKASRAFEITQTTSLSVVKTLLAFGINAGIKWPNDIYVSGKKICGMLIENSFSGDYVNYSIMGIGVNVNNELPAELKEIATSMAKERGAAFDVQTVGFTLAYNLQNPEKVGLYARYSIVLGKKIKVIKSAGQEFFAVAEKVLDDGRLLLDTGEALSSAEVSLRI